MSRGRLTAREALRTVGLDVDQLRSALDKVLAEGEGYLVGSLACGLGNAASDVDVHVLREGVDEPSGPQLFFVGGVTVDVERYPAHWPAELARRAAAAAVVGLPFGVVALDRPIAGRSRRWASRWPSALPLRDGAPPVLDESDVRAVLPLLLRSALDQLLLATALARLADAAAAPADARRYLWRRAERQVLELRCRAAGDVTTGQKWLSDRAHRLGLAVAEPAGDEASLRSATAAAGVPALDEWALTALRPAGGARQADLAGKRFLVTRHDRVLTEWTEVDGSVRSVVDQIGAARALAAVRRAELDLVVDGDAVRQVLADHALPTESDRSAV
ncbi:hypothetical protein LX15_001832 [Streptoalloteichus tenebrarius]|uniref:Polymerase nucleotidyl transferase domain-containing protein n=1 Tax=Streptoalloteichus tenebrarius (strain ATCC 17920 / DSM 40477 / JCM 4838 / CBS 697.72 / NBRC 16177 / NCIMB 11028 / NRRL B-12390 / A12253. 1 / ISP 5477) TaxID=1933 RepID=A0ABT1HRJ9_STRSD|nr:hypothetical protein [Streptoalloteichus tenebrarius]MCP2258138.1 hypothetical protein [Streptoalloteichus tenebrarius]BFF04635.1 hypothetical protein GCM10020241_63100 [Streptoalloteichus tenebrarius]